jgi:flavin reductase (DIM6/NTAB) family NADH-FMN oxidoreductase RutF
MNQLKMDMALQDSSKAFRMALGRFPTGVTVITARDPISQAPVGLTVSSFNSLSLNPPLVIWAISNKSPNLPAFTKGQSHFIHVLNAGQAELAKNFATPKADKFAGIALSPNTEEQDPPRLAESCVWFNCITEELVQAGDHTLVIARVKDYETYENESLVFCKSSFFSSEALERISG